MNEDRHDSSQQSVLLRIDAGGFSISSIDLAVEIAASIQQRLHALFIEDEDLLHVAGLPCTREISFATAQEIPTDVEQMERSLRSMAEQYRKILQQAAQASQIAWSFDIVRGRSDDIELASELNVVYTVVGQPVSRKAESSRFKRTRRILLIENQSPHLFHALNVVLHRFKSDNVEVTIITDPQKQTPTTEDDLLKQIPRTTQVISLVMLPHEQLSERLDQPEINYDCAIISRHENPHDLREMLKKLKCPVILVS